MLSLLFCFLCTEEQRKCKLCHSAWVAFYALFASPDSTRSRQVLSMEGERGRLKPAATAGRAPVQTGKATVQGKASDQPLRFTAEDIWARSVEHMGQILKKKSRTFSFSSCLYQHPAVQHLLHVTNREEASLLLRLCLYQHNCSLAWDGSAYSQCDTAQSSRKLGDFCWKERWGALLKDAHLTRRTTLIFNCMS